MSTIAIETFNEFVKSKYPTLLLAIGVIILGFYVWNQSTQVDDHGREVAQSRERIIKLEADVTMIKEDLRELKDDMKKVKEDIAEIKATLKHHDEQMVEIRADISEIRTDIKTLLNRH